MPTAYTQTIRQMLNLFVPSNNAPTYRSFAPSDDNLDRMRKMGIPGYALSLSKKLPPRSPCGLRRGRVKAGLEALPFHLTDELCY